MSVLNFWLPLPEATELEKIAAKEFPLVAITAYPGKDSNRVQFTLEVPPEGVPVPKIFRRILELPGIVRGERES